VNTNNGVKWRRFIVPKRLKKLMSRPLVSSEVGPTLAFLALSMSKSCLFSIKKILRPKKNLLIGYSDV